MSELENSMYAIVRNLHLAFGGTSLVLFWLQLVMRKGGARHRALGKAYVAAMAVVLTTGVPMTVYTWLRGQQEAALLLGFLLLITAVAGIEALLAVHHRTSGEWRKGLVMRAATVAICAYSVGLVALYFRWPHPLLLILGGFGLLATVESVIREKKDAPYDWLQEHLGAMLATGIAVHVAFLAFGVRRLLGDSSLTVWAFVVPIALGHLLTVFFRRRYSARAQGAGNSRAEPAIDRPRLSVDPRS